MSSDVCTLRPQPSRLLTWLLTAAFAAMLILPGAQAQTPKPNKAAVLEPADTPSVLAVQPVWTADGAAAHPTAAAPSAQPFVLFGQWVQPYEARPVAAYPVGQVFQPVDVPAPSNGTRYEPLPVILGQPELPLLDQQQHPATGWNASLNYQGLSLSLLVLNPANGQYQVRSLQQGLQAGEMFRLRYTASFDSIASLDRIDMHPQDHWLSFRNGQAWPAPGQSVQARADETVELPLQPGQHFVMQPGLLDALVLSVRHPLAKDDLRSDQPTYRQDGPLGSQYLQLIPPQQLPAIEQLLTIHR